MLMGLVSWMDMLTAVICHSRLMLPVGPVRSYSADDAEAVLPWLYSECMARPGQDNRLLHKAPQFVLPSLVVL